MHPEKHGEGFERLKRQRFFVKFSVGFGFNISLDRDNPGAEACAGKPLLEESALNEFVEFAL